MQRLAGIAGRLCPALAFTFACTAACLAQVPGAQQPAPPIRIAIGSVTPSATVVPMYEMVELTVEMRANFDNPYDPEQVALDAQITPPLGKPYQVPGFWYLPYKRAASGPQPQGPGAWKVRLAFTEPGGHRILLTAKDKSGTIQSEPIDLLATAATGHGFVRISPRDPRYFEFTDGAPYFPIGSSLPARSLAEYDLWIRTLSSSGGNAARIFLSPPGSLFSPQNRTQKVRMDPIAGFRVDEALRVGQSAGVHTILCIGTPSELEQRQPGWLNNALNKDNGGPLESPRRFWTDPAVKPAYVAYLRYLVARYGAFRGLLAWEMWRDTDLTYGYEPEIAREFFDVVSQRLIDLDAYDHLVTISFAAILGERPLDRLAGVSFTQTHVYDLPDLVPATTLQQAKKATYGKPHWVTEVAASRKGPRGELDRNGLQVHNPAWASIVSGAAGAAMPWWWESYLFPKRTSNRFRPLAAFVHGVNWPGEHFRSTTPAFDYQKAPVRPVYRDLVISNGPVSFGNTEYNLPRHVRIWPSGVQYGLPVSGILHGQKLHASKFNPIRFTMDIKRPTTFEILVTEVSGLGGGYIQVKLDGEVVMGMDLRDPNGMADDTPITTYNGAYGLHVPAGHHVLTVANTGLDWVKASYRFRDLLPRKTPPLTGVCLAGDRTVLAWVRHADRSWDRVHVQKRPVTPCAPTKMTLRGLIPGAWRVDLWDTWNGKVVKSSLASVGSEGECSINLPEIAADLAVKMTRTNRAR